MNCIKYHIKKNTLRITMNSSTPSENKQIWDLKFYWNFLEWIILITCEQYLGPHTSTYSQFNLLHDKTMKLSFFFAWKKNQKTQKFNSCYVGQNPEIIKIFETLIYISSEFRMCVGCSFICWHEYYNGICWNSLSISLLFNLYSFCSNK